MTPQLLLAFDTSGPHCTAAVMRDGQLVAHSTEAMARGQAERLMGLLDETLRAAAADWHDLSAIAVGVGPGNFTGIRISVSAARGLGLGLDCPVLGISTFEAYAPSSGKHTIALPAPRDMVYLHDVEDGSLTGSPRHIASELVDSDALTSVVLDADTIAPNLAQVALRHLQHGRLPLPKPLYVKAPDAAPARDPGPRILS